MGLREPRRTFCFLVVSHNPNERQRLRSRLIIGLFESEYPNRSIVVRWCRQVDDEASGEQIRSFVGGFAPVVDVYVGKRCRRVSDVGTLRELSKDLANGLVDRSRVVILIGLSELIKLLLARVDRGVICLVVDHKERHVRDRGFALQASVAWLTISRLGFRCVD